MWFCPPSGYTPITQPCLLLSLFLVTPTPRPQGTLKVSLGRASLTGCPGLPLHCIPPLGIPPIPPTSLKSFLLPLTLVCNVPSIPASSLLTFLPPSLLKQSLYDVECRDSGNLTDPEEGPWPFSAYSFLLQNPPFMVTFWRDSSITDILASFLLAKPVKYLRSNRYNMQGPADGRS